jgi:streptogramin lyase
VFAVSIDSSALTVVDARTSTIVRTVPLSMRPGAVAVGDDAVWVADARRGLVVRLDGSYERVIDRATWSRERRTEATGLSRPEPTAVALAGAAAWVTDGSNRLVRVDARTARVSRVRTPHRLDDVVAGGGALWAVSTSGAAVVRVDPATARVTDVIPIVARPGSEAPAPISVAATRDRVWVLNGNTATVSRIDVAHRGIEATVQLGVDQSPRDVETAAGSVWVANFDGSVTRIPPRGPPITTFIGESLTGVAGTRNRLWAAVTALDQQFPGGAG